MFHHRRTLSELIRYHANKVSVVDSLENKYKIEQSNFTLYFKLDKSLNDYVNHYKESDLSVTDCSIVAWVGRWNSETTISSEELPTTALFCILNSLI